MIRLSQDILERFRADFTGNDLDALWKRLEKASTTPRIQRCILFASRGNLDHFLYLCDLARIDYRDVIMAGEYDRFDTRLYDFNLPFEEAALANPYGQKNL